MGGLTAPMLTLTGMRSHGDSTSDNGFDDQDTDSDDDDEQSLLVPKSPISSSVLGNASGVKTTVDEENNLKKSGYLPQKKGIRSSWRDFEDR